ncbi:heparan-alpha-glucosaminide N-acetyltransferase [uncultured Rhodoblastus sp.]|uniref:DUF1624 domain-containing protein n=1 Tax=uncultured Rhodoblastus sp. TaxID=543037 RepID=UPI0025FB4497|nr:heparan-alpha-glucosaminide N-acetyltransferase [uncultured Rhodoblastus sp.]
MTAAERGGPIRLPLVDLARGLALWAMLVFHLIWDLAAFGWIDADAPHTPFLRWFGHAIAVSFLLLVGYSLVLAQNATGLEQGPLWRSAKFWRRWGQIALAAAAISAVSFFLFAETPIFFGMLHCIALSSLIALPLLAAPAALAFVLGVAALAAPHFLASSLFDAKIFWWTGLGTYQPPSNDFRPLLPWLAFVLFGMALAKWAKLPLPVSTRRGRGERGLGRALTFCGRHSLAFYLIHQPVLFGLFTLLGFFVTPTPDAGPFQRQCAMQCVNAGAAAELCEKSCACVIDRAKSAGLWNVLARDRLTEAQKSLVHDAAMACYADSATK